MKNINRLILCTLLYATITTADQKIPNIFQDVREGNKEAIRKRLENCEDCAVKDEKGNNALHIAAKKGDTEIVEILTTAPDCSEWMNWLYSFLYAPTLPNINDANNDGDTPLLCTIKGNKPDNANVLIQKHANMEIVNKENLSAIFAAIKQDAPQFIPIFVAHKLDLNKHRRNGDTIFHYAIKENKPKSIRHCAQETSLIHASNNDHKTPTFLGIDTENIALLELLHKGLNIPANNGVKPIHYATQNGKYTAIDYILTNNIPVDEPDHEGNPALFYANSKDMMNYLFSCGADIQKRNNRGEDVFAVAARNKNPQLAQYLAQLPGIDINARDKKGQTSFMRSSITQDYEGMQRLISMGVNIRITDTMNENALHKMARIGSDKGAKIILNHDNSLLVDRNKDGLTPLSVAAQQKEHDDLLALLIAYKADVNTEDNNGLTPLHHAAAHDNVEAMIMLQNHGALYTQRTNKNNTLAHSAAEKGAVHTLDYCIRLNAQLLFARNTNNETPLTIAAKNGHVETVKVLLRDTDFISKEIHSAMEIARKNGHRNVFTFLQQKDAERISECQNIINIRIATDSLVNENNHSRALLCQKHPLYLLKYITHTPTDLDNYSKNELYTMTEAERNKIKNFYLQGQNKELNLKNNLRQELNTIAREEERAAAEKVIKEELIRQQQQAELNRIAAERRTVVLAQQAELDRVAERNRAQHADEERARILERNRTNEQTHIVTFQRQEIPIFLPTNQNYPVQEDDENANSTDILEEGDCCICLQHCTKEHGIRRMPCESCKKGSSRICKECLDDCIATQKSKHLPVTCPTCNL